MTLTRRRLILAAPALIAARPALAGPLDWGSALAYRASRLIVGDALAREYPESAMSPEFRTNGSTRPGDPVWQRLARGGFENWQMPVEGLVARPQAFSLSDLRAMPARTQITRHDCVEGWSAIGKWTGVPLSEVLDRVGLEDRARYVVFHCADTYQGQPYYESLDLADARHPQTILAYGMNGADLPVGHGAPLRLRVERQLGYKHAKFLMRLEVVESLAAVRGGAGGTWEDLAGYAWYAGI